MLPGKSITRRGGPTNWALGAHLRPPCTGINYTCLRDSQQCRQREEQLSLHGRGAPVVGMDSTEVCGPITVAVLIHDAGYSIGTGVRVLHSSFGLVLPRRTVCG